MERGGHLKLAKSYWKEILAAEDVAIDATLGNGKDSLFLARLPLSHLLALDIQEEAIRKSQALFEKELQPEEIQKIHLRLGSHERLDLYELPKAPKLIVYNLGYLPGGDKNLTTRVETTLSSVESALSILAPKGAVSIACYPGHEEGKREEEALLSFAEKLPSKFEAVHHRWLNRKNSPSLLWIARLDDA